MYQYQSSFGEISFTETQFLQKVYCFEGMNGYLIEKVIELKVLNYQEYFTHPDTDYKCGEFLYLSSYEEVHITDLHVFHNSLHWEAQGFDLGYSFKFETISYLINNKYKK